MSDCGRLWSLDAATGEVLWQTDTPGFPERWMAGSPAVAGGVVYAGAKSGYGACDARTGEQLWFRRFSGTLDLIADPTGDKWGAWFTPVVCGGLLICLVPRRALTALDRESGRIVWEHVLPASQDWWASPILAGDAVVSGGEPNRLLAVRARDGGVLFDEKVLDESAAADNYVTGLAAEGPLLYAGTGDGKVIACDLDTGKMRWEFQTGEALLDMAPQRRGGSTVLAPPVIHGGQVVACGADGVIYHLNADSGDCEGTTRVRVADNGRAGPARGRNRRGNLGWSAQAVRRLNGRLLPPVRGALNGPRFPRPRRNAPKAGILRGMRSALPHFNLLTSEEHDEL